jgi:hypothetical protein
LRHAKAMMANCQCQTIARFPALTLMLSLLRCNGQKAAEKLRMCERACPVPFVTYLPGPYQDEGHGFQPCRQMGVDEAFRP